MFLTQRAIVSAHKLNEVNGSNPVTPSKEPGVPEYFAFGSSMDYQASQKRVSSHVSPAKQARIHGINQSDGMKQALNYDDNDRSYGLVNIKNNGTKGLLFVNAASQGDRVYKPKVTLQWNEPYRTPLTLQ